MRRTALIAAALALSLALPGCARLGLRDRVPAAVPAGTDTPRPLARPAAVTAAAAPALRPRPPAFGGAAARPAAALDTTTPAERAAATAAPAGGVRLGETTVSLGSPAEPGFWLRTPLVTAPRPGTVVLATGRTVQVELRPGAGAAQLSLAAYRALGLALTDLPRVTVLAR
jgi:hypothetical protein